MWKGIIRKDWEKRLRERIERDRRKRKGIKRTRRERRIFTKREETNTQVLSVERKSLKRIRRQIGQEAPAQNQVEKTSLRFPYCIIEEFRDYIRHWDSYSQPANNHHSWGEFKPSTHSQLKTQRALGGSKATRIEIIESWTNVWESWCLDQAVNVFKRILLL